MFLAQRLAVWLASPFEDLSPRWHRGRVAQHVAMADLGAADEGQTIDGPCTVPMGRPVRAILLHVSLIRFSVVKARITKTYPPPPPPPQRKVGQGLAL